MKDVLVVINTLGRAGAETALMELLRQFDPAEYSVSLYVLTNQGELVHELPEYVRLLNRHYRDISVLSRKGKRALAFQVLHAMCVRGTVIKCLPYLLHSLAVMLSEGRFLPDKLLWRVLSEGGERFEKHFHLAVAYLEGGSAYYVADHVEADRKAVFLHVDYGRAGYTRMLDRDCYLKYDKIFPVSGEVRDSFLKVYPECAPRTEVFHNMLDRDRVRRMSLLPGGFDDGFRGKRILTVGRLTAQKALEVSVEAMKLLKESGAYVRWYVLGEGDARGALEERIRRLGLSSDFLLLGAVDNPYPYMLQADVYVHASRFEGRSIAIQEAQILGKAVLVSDCSGNREQVEDGVDGMMCSLSPEEICGRIKELLGDEGKRRRLGEAAASRKTADASEMDKLLSLIRPARKT